MTGEILLATFSIGMMLLGGILWQKGKHLIANGKKAKAIIFRNNYKISGRSGGVYYPVIRFMTDKQEWITQELSFGYLPAKREGTRLEVIYDPDDPSIVEIASTLQLEVFPKIFVAIGVGLFILTVLELLGVIQVVP